MHNKPTIDLDRERIACVFGLGGGELHVSDERFPDEWDSIIAYWYAGPPDYATDLKDAEFLPCKTCGGSGSDLDDCDECNGDGAEFRPIRTAIICCLFGFPTPPPGWERIASFSSSGEASCWWCGDGTGNETERPACKLCEGGGYVYLGDGMYEVVYRHSGAVD